MSSIALVQVHTDHNHLSVIVLPICLQNGVQNKGKQSLHQLFGEPLNWEWEELLVSLVSSSKFNSFWLKNISHILPLQSSYLIKLTGHVSRQIGSSQNTIVTNAIVQNRTNVHQNILQHSEQFVQQGLSSLRNFTFGRDTSY